MTFNKTYQYYDDFSKDEHIIVCHCIYNSPYVMF